VDLPSLSAEDGELQVESGTANVLRTPQVTLSQGVYFVTPYNCLSSASDDYYVQFTAEVLSGTIDSGVSDYNFSQLHDFTINPFILKIRSAMATVVFKVWNPHGGTIIHTLGNCTHFIYSKIAN